ncbi:MAG TPA: metallophosphoesterase [Geobacteraceae bacterium]|nr:metallophosphoesterase [Geobacteraceae bacterium]
MKIMVVSDTHGNYLAPLACLDENAGIDLIIHLGDEINDGRMLQSLTSIPVILVPGNCDPDAREPRELCGVLGGQRIFMTHGDIYRVKNGLDALIRKAVSEKASVALFGHTHTPLVLEENGLLLVNPGTLMTASTNKSFAVLTVSGKSASAEIFQVPTP